MEGCGLIGCLSLDEAWRMTWSRNGRAPEADGLWLVGMSFLDGNRLIFIRLQGWCKGLGHGSYSAFMVFLPDVASPALPPEVTLFVRLSVCPLY